MSGNIYVFASGPVSWSWLRVQFIELHCPLCLQLCEHIARSISLLHLISAAFCAHFHLHCTQFLLKLLWLELNPFNLIRSDQ